MIGPRGIALAVGALAAVCLAGSLAINLRQAKAIAAQKACAAAIEPDARLGADPRKLCPPVIAGRWARAVQAETCDAALSARPENRYGVANNCSGPVKVLQARRDAAVGERDSARSELTTLRSSQAAAIRRAQADAQTQAERKFRAAQAVERAPRTAAGLVVCDAACLRQRTGAIGPAD